MYEPQKMQRAQKTENPQQPVRMEDSDEERTLQPDPEAEDVTEQAPEEIMEYPFDIVLEIVKVHTDEEI